MNTEEAKRSVEDSKIPESIKAGIEALAKGLGVAAVELWSIFVRQYIVRGISELFTALLLISMGVFLIHLVAYWSLIPMVAALPFIYGTIPLLGNPKYYAITDITNKIQEIK